MTYAPALWPHLPRTVVATLLVAIGAHVVAAVTGLLHPYYFPASDWVALILAELALLFAVLHDPVSFRIRSFRLPGVAISSLAMIILAPLPGVVRPFGDLLPRAMILSIAAGVFAMAAVFLAGGRRPRPRRVETHGPIEPLFPLAIVVAAAIALPLWLRTIGTPPLLELFRGGSTATDLALARQGALSNLGSLPLRVAVGVLRNLYLMFAGGWLVAELVTTSRADWRRRSARRIAATGGLGLGILFALLTTERAIVGEVIVIGGIAALIASGRPLSGKVVGALGGLALTFPLAVGLLSGAGSLGETLTGLQRRAFFLPADVMARHFAAFPAELPHLGGSSIPKLSLVRGGETFDLSGFIYTRFYQQDVAIEGNANGTFIGVGWANFGTLGVIVWCAVAAIALLWLDRFLDRIPIRSGAALRGLAVILTVLLTSTGLFRSILGFAPGFLDLVFAMWVISVIERRRSPSLTGHTTRAPLHSPG